MWGKNKRSEESFRVNTDRLTSVLGLDLKETADDLMPNEAPLPETEPSVKTEHISPDEASGQSASCDHECDQEPKQPIGQVALDHLAVQKQSELAGIGAMSEAFRSLTEALTQKAGEALNAPLKPEIQQTRNGKAVTSLPAPTTYVGPRHPAPAEERHGIAEKQLDDLPAKSEELLEERAKLFEEVLAAIVNKSLSQCEATVHRTVSRLEASLAQAKEIQSSLGESLASLTRQAMEAVQTQTKTLEGDLSKVAQLIESQVTAGLQPVTNRIHECRAEAEEVQSTLQANLARLTHEAAEAVSVQAQSFEQKVAAISEQAAGQAHKTLESRMSQLQESSLHSLEDQIRAAANHLQRSHLESLQRGLDDSFESSRANIQLVQQGLSSFSADILNQMRSESENIARNFHQQLQSDAQAVAASMVATMRSRLQKLADEFGKMFEGAFEER